MDDLGYDITDMTDIDPVIKVKFLGRGERLFALTENPAVTSYLIHDP